MRNLVVLALVCGVASMASAGLYFTVPSTVQENSAFSIVVGSDVVGKIDGGLYGTISALSADVFAKAGDLGSATDFTADFGGWDFSAADLGAAGTKPLAAGDWFSFNFQAGKAGEQYTMGLYNYAVSYDTPVATAIVTVVPEPATMALLGLGGLFFARKK